MIDEIKIFLKVYPEKLDRFKQSIHLGSLIEIKYVRKYFSNDFNFVFRSDYKPDQLNILDGFSIEPNLTFKQRLRKATEDGPLPVVSLNSINTMTVTRNCLKVNSLIK